MRAIAICGVGAVLPGASSLEEFRNNLLLGKDSSADVPESRWIISPDKAFKPGNPSPDRVYSKRACLVDEFEYDIGNSLDRDFLSSLDPVFRMTLAAGFQAFRDGVTEGLDRARAGVILGAIALPTEKFSALAWEILGSRYESELLKNGNGDQTGQFREKSGNKAGQCFTEYANEKFKYKANIQDEEENIRKQNIENSAGNKNKNHSLRDEKASLNRKNKYFGNAEESEDNFVSCTFSSDFISTGGGSFGGLDEDLNRKISSLATESPENDSREFFSSSINPVNYMVAGKPALLLGEALGFGGPCYALDAACASTLYALKLACDELESGRVDLMLAGGVSRPDPLYTQMGFSQLKALSKGICRPFDKDADGLVTGEGAGIFLLKRLEDAVRDKDRIYGVIRGAGLSNDIAGNLLAPSTEGQLRAMRKAYEDAGWSPHDVDFVECHATGTPVGDEVELESLRRLRSGISDEAVKRPCYLGAVKANVGHLLTAAGAAALLKVLLSFSGKTIFPVANLQKPCSLLEKMEKEGVHAPGKVIPWNTDNGEPRRAAISSFGFGGINAHLLVEEYLHEGADIPSVNSSNNSSSVDVSHNFFHSTPHSTHSGTQQSLTATHSKDKIIPEPVAVIGMEASFGEWTDHESVWKRICETGNTSPGTIHYMRRPHVPMGRLRIPPLEIEEMLPQQLFALLTAKAALESSGLNMSRERLDAGVFIGIALDAGTSDFHVRWKLEENAGKPGIRSGEEDISNADEWIEKLKDGFAPPLTANRTVGALGGMVASRVARELRFGGSSFTVSAEGNSASTAIYTAVRELRTRSLNLALAGAVDLPSDIRTVLCRRALHENNNLPICDGAAFFVLKRLEDALKDGNRVLAVINDVDLSLENMQEPDKAAMPDAGHWGDHVPGICSLSSETVDISLNEEDLGCIDFSVPRIVSASRKTGNAGAAFGAESWLASICALSERLLPSSAKARQPWLTDIEERPRRACIITESDKSVFRADLEEGRSELQLKTVFPNTPDYRIKGFGHPEGELAFVFPGSGNHVHAGLELALDFPEILRLQEDESKYHKSQLINAWNGNRNNKGDLRPVILGQVALGTFLSDLARYSGIKPHAAIGYSLGETTSLFAMRIWRDRDGMFSALKNSTLFSEDLAGECGLARRALGLQNGSFAWETGVAVADEESLMAEIRKRKNVFRLIRNTATSIVIGGSKDAVHDLISSLKCPYYPLRDVSTVHVPFVSEVAREYFDLHDLEVFPNPDIRLYSNAAAAPIHQDRKIIAESLLKQAVEGFDFVKLIERAYTDGVRVFLEIGPGSSCTRMISEILHGREHLAKSLCPGDNKKQFFECLMELKQAGVPVDENFLRKAGYEFREVERPAEFRTTTEENIYGEHKEKNRGRDRVIMKTRLNRSSLPGNMSMADAHELFLRISGDTEAMTARIIEKRQKLLSDIAANPGLISEAALQQSRAACGSTDSSSCVIKKQNGMKSFSGSFNIRKNHHEEKSLYNREKCLEFARGKISDVLGSAYSSIDSHPTRVRLPDVPLCLVDRIISVEGEMGGLGSGRIITEHDILPDAWYLDGGKIPISVAVEAGQADLFLSAWLGIDFITKGERVYRLLDAVVSFHDELPGPGNTIRYDIRIERFFRQGSIWLFRFCFDATCNGRPLLTMRDGCAGFFSEEELDAGQGVVKGRLSEKDFSGSSHGADALLPLSSCTLESEQLDRLREGDLEACFGDLFKNLPIKKPLTIPGGMMRLVHRVTNLDPHGGSHGLGFIRAEADINPDDWFLVCHFVDDMVMPGTLMYECCAHTLRVLLLRMGWLGEEGIVAWEPVPGVKSRLACRGQVIASTRTAAYEVTVKSVSYEPEPTVIVDALMKADEKPIVAITDMSMRLSGQTREGLKKIFVKSLKRTDEPGIQTEVISDAIQNLKSAACHSDAEPVERGIDKTGKTVSSDIRNNGMALTSKRKVLYGPERILAFSIGKPSEAFGEPYRVFDSERIIARLPGPPYLFMDRVLEVCGEPFRLEAGASVVSEMDVDPNAWYFKEDRQNNMPFAVLLETALQPCGWLAAYTGSALSGDVDLSFRNLGGKAVYHRPANRNSGVLTVRAGLDKLASSGGMLIQHYSISVEDVEGYLYKGTTYFGFFSKAALANQVGIQNAEALVDLNSAQKTAFVKQAFPADAPFSFGRWKMLDHLEYYEPDGGPKSLGLIQGAMDVNPSAWFFDAHFYQDPVCPGSLGIESFIQLLKFIAVDKCGLGQKTEFIPLAPGSEHEWIYRGQVIPSDRKVFVEAEITSFESEEGILRADGQLSVDGRIIYSMNDFALAWREK